MGCTPLFARPIALTVLLLVLFPVAAGTTAAAGPYDGTYRGRTQISGVSRPDCAKDGSAVEMTVADGKVSYNHFGSVLTGAVARDGSFSASGMNLRYKTPTMQSISGQISGAGAEADTKASGCAYHVKFAKS